ncbi:MAG: ACP S-malonyltransferase [Pseudomonadota bacterium]
MMTTAFVFPGQGSQSKGMLADAYDAFEAVSDTFTEASDALGYDLWAVCKDDADGSLSHTEVTQPALLTSSVALWRAWLAQGGAQPAMLAGHSLGEYSALTCAGSFRLADAVKLVRLRGQLMQQAVPEGTGAMAAILGLDDDVVIAACEAVSSGVVSAANFNAPGQVVIAGEKAAVDEAIGHCKEGGARRAMPLPVSVPSHCALMQPAADAFVAALADIEIGAPAIAVVNNVDVAVETDANAIRDALVRQLYSPVQWSASVRHMVSDHATDFVECGPNKVLSGLLRRIHKPASAYVIETVEDMAATHQSISEGAAQ